jgi:hypothetical protein
MLLMYSENVSGKIFILKIDEETDILSLGFFVYMNKCISCLSSRNKASIIKFNVIIFFFP